MFVAHSKADAAPIPDSLRGEPSLVWKQIIEPVEPFLEAVGARLSKQVTSFEPDLLPYAEYALNANGKHLRPALVALTAEALGKQTDAHVTVAVIIEMVHLATLVHDDIMDEAEIRRGRLTLAANWGNEIAVLFGDCLFAQALKLASSFPTTDVCRAVSLATNTVCSGEILQTKNRRDFEFGRAKYFKVIGMKTAELFALSCELSAFLSGAGHERRQASRDFGLAFGTAYQVYDDCIDLFGTEAAAGKSLGTDLAKGKLTLPVLLAWERADSRDRDRLKELVKAWEPDSMQTMGGLLLKYDSLNGSLEILEEYLAKARGFIQGLPSSGGRSCLACLTDFLQQQTELLGVSA
jgi:octaprenyl-diphosphate synthase